MDESLPISRHVYPYKQDATGLNWAWMATTMGATTAVVAMAAHAKMKDKSLHPAAAAAAAVIGGWVGAKIILPA